MANVKISDLTAAGAVSGTQEFEVNDSLVSKKVTGAQVKSYVLSTGSVTETTIANDAVTSSKIANNAVGSTEIANASVTLGKLSATGTASSSTYLRGDDTWAAVTSLSTASGSAPSYSARAWVNFNGQGTVAIRASGNVSSITDNNTGDYTVNFTTAMSDANFSVSIAGSLQDNTVGSGNILTQLSRATTPLTTTSARFLCSQSSIAAGNTIDLPTVTVTIFR